MSGPLGPGCCSPLGPSGGGGGGLPVASAVDQLVVWDGSAWIAGPVNLSAPAARTGLLPIANIDPAGAAANQVLAFVAGSVTWATLTPVVTPPTNPGQNGFVAVASAGNLTYVGGTVAGRPLLWSGSAWAEGTALGSNVYNIDTTAGALQLGVAGAVFATVGAVRMPTRAGIGFYYRRGASPGTADMLGVQFGSGSDDRLVLGDPTTGVGNIVANLASSRLQVGATAILGWTSTAVDVTVGVLNFSGGGSIQNQGTTMINFPTGGNRNIQLFGTGATINSSDRVMIINDRVAVPGADPNATSFYFYSDAGKPTFGYATGTVLKFSVAAAAATAGAGALPATPQEFLTIILNGNTRKIPLYLN